MAAEKRDSFEEFYRQWQADPSQVMVVEAIDQILFQLKQLGQSEVAHDRRFEMSDERFDGLEGRLSGVTTEVARWRGDIRLMRDRT